VYSASCIDGAVAKHTIVNSGGVAALTAVADAFPRAHALHRLVCGTLWSLATDADISAAAPLASRSTVALVARSMTDFAGFADVQHSGAGVMLYIAAASSSNRFLVLEQRGDALVQRAMAQHASVAEVQEVGLGALLELARDGDALVAAMPRVIAAMSAHIGVTNVQQLGCVVISRCFADGAGADAPTTRAVLPATDVAAAAMQCAVDAVVAHPSHAGVVQCGVQAVLNAATHATLLPLLMGVGAVRALATVVAGDGGAAVAVPALTALLHVAGSAVGRAAVAAPVTLQAIVRCVRDGAGDADVIHAAMQLLQVLSRDPAAREAMVTSACVDVVLHALARYRHDDVVQRCGDEVLANTSGRLAAGRGAN
jgi:hypothetical protein